MAPPLGSKFWQKRSKHGRNTLFKSAEAVWLAACEYFEWCDDNPEYINEWKAIGDGKYGFIKTPIKRPYTMQGLCRYLNCNTGYFAEFKRELPKVADQQAFLDVIKDIEEAVYEQKFTGAVSGQFNASIIARDLGLADQHKVDAKNTQINITPLSPDEIKRISEDFDNEL